LRAIIVEISYIMTEEGTVRVRTILSSHEFHENSYELSLASCRKMEIIPSVKFSVEEGGNEGVERVRVSSLSSKAHKARFK
jgi:hypothetical protein